MLKSAADGIMSPSKSTKKSKKSKGRQTENHPEPPPWRWGAARVAPAPRVESTVNRIPVRKDPVSPPSRTTSAASARNTSLENKPPPTGKKSKKISGTKQASKPTTSTSAPSTSGPKRTPSAAKIKRTGSKKSLRKKTLEPPSDHTESEADASKLTQNNRSPSESKIRRTESKKSLSNLKVQEPPEPDHSAEQLEPEPPSEQTELESEAEASEAPKPTQSQSKSDRRPTRKSKSKSRVNKSLKRESQSEFEETSAVPSSLAVPDTRKTDSNVSSSTKSGKRSTFKKKLNKIVSKVFSSFGEEDDPKDHEENDHGSKGSKGKKKNDKSLKSVKHKIGVRRDVMRLRSLRHSVFNFRPVDDEFKQAEDPLATENIKKSSNFNYWMRTVHLGLPSNVGVPVENTSHVMNVVVNAMEQNRKRSFQAKAAYNNVYDEVQKKSLSDDKNPSDDAGGTKSRVSIFRRITALRELAVALSEKRVQKKAFIEEELKNDKLKNEKRTYKEIIAKFFLRTHHLTREVLGTLTMWKTTMHNIHGKYGMGAASYFNWLRIILVFNILYAITVICLIILPELAQTDIESGHACPVTVVSLPKCVLLPTITPKKRLGFLDLFTGTGFFERTMLFYSGYRDPLTDSYCPGYTSQVFLGEEAIDPPSTLGTTAFRFILVSIIMFIFNATFVGAQVKHYYHRIQMETKIPGLNEHDKYRALFCAWDFNCSDPMGATMQHRSIWRDFKIAVSDTMDKETLANTMRAHDPKLINYFKKRLGVGKQWASTCVHIAANSLVALMYIISAVILFFTFKIREHRVAEKICEELLGTPSGLLILPSICISILYIIVSKVCQMISRYELWDSSKNRNFAFIARLGIYYLMIIIIIYGYWYRKATILLGNLCYEEYFGQEIFRIIWFQGILDFLLSFIGYRIYHFALRRKYAEYSKPKFNAASSTLNLMFLHTLSGMGFLFCPPLSIILCIRLVWTFYNHKNLLMQMSRFPTHATHQSEIVAPYLVAFVLSFFVTTCLNMLLLAELNPSSTCGPFSHFGEKVTGHLGNYWEVFTEGASSGGLFYYIVNPGVSFVLMIIFAAVCYTLQQWGNGYVRSMEKLYHFLLLERKDRHFLLEAIYETVKKNAEAEEGRSTTASSFTQLPSGQPEGGRDSWKDSVLVQGIFAHRRGTLAINAADLQQRLHTKMSDMSFQSFQQRSLLDGEDTHGTVGRGLKEEFYWLPSQWNRRQRRSAVTSGFTDADRAEFLKIYRAQIAENASRASIGQSMMSESDVESEVIKEDNKNSSEIAARQLEAIRKKLRKSRMIEIPHDLYHDEDV